MRFEQIVDADVAGLRKYLDADGDPNGKVKGAANRTILSLLCEYAETPEHEEMVRILVATRGVDVNLGSQRPLCHAAYRGNLAAVNALLSHLNILPNIGGFPSRANPSVIDTTITPLFLATTAGHAAVVSALCDHPHTSVNAATSEGPALHRAALVGHVGVLTALLSRADIDVNRSFPLAVVEGDEPRDVSALRVAAAVASLAVVERLLGVEEVDVDFTHPIVAAISRPQPSAAIVRAIATDPRSAIFAPVPGGRRTRYLLAALAACSAAGGKADDAREALLDAERAASAARAERDGALRKSLSGSGGSGGGDGARHGGGGGGGEAAMERLTATGKSSKPSTAGGAGGAGGRTLSKAEVEALAARLSPSKEEHAAKVAEAERKAAASAPAVPMVGAGRRLGRREVEELVERNAVAAVAAKEERLEALRERTMPTAPSAALSRSEQAALAARLHDDDVAQRAQRAAERDATLFPERRALGLSRG